MLINVYFSLNTSLAGFKPAAFNIMRQRWLIIHVCPSCDYFSNQYMCAFETQRCFTNATVRTGSAYEQWQYISTSYCQ